MDERKFLPFGVGAPSLSLLILSAEIHSHLQKWSLVSARLLLFIVLRYPVQRLLDLVPGGTVLLLSLDFLKLVW